MAFDFPSSPTTGQTYSVTGGPTYVYNGTAWVVLTPGNQFNRTVFTATAGQTTFSMNYVVGAIDVYRNGVKLVNTTDFTATNGTSIVLANGCTVGDTVEVISYPMITYSDAVRRTGDTMTGALAVPSLTVNSVPILVGPAFSADDAATTATANVQTKIVFDTELFDTDGAFDGAKFQPTVAGYYQINLRTANGGSTNQGVTGAYIYKNGAQIINSIIFNPAGTGVAPAVSTVAYLNGTTDYIEFYGLNSGNANLGRSWASAIMIRAA